MNSLIFLSSITHAADVLFNYYDLEAWPEACKVENPQQSPINLVTADLLEETTLDLSFNFGDQFKAQQVIDTDLSLNKEMQVVTTASNKEDVTLTFNKIKYVFSAMHSHWGSSEHTIDNKASSGCFHAIFTGQDPSNKEEMLLVIEILVDFVKDASVADIAAKDFPRCPSGVGADLEGPELVFNPFESVIGKSAIHYIGSLTTPTCGTPVNWVVISDPMTVEDDSTDMGGCQEFATQFPHCAPGSSTCPTAPGNYRPTLAKLESTVPKIVTIKAKDSAESAPTATTTTVKPVANSAGTTMVGLPGMICALMSIWLL